MKKIVKKIIHSLPLIRALYFSSIERAIKKAEFVFLHSITPNIGDLKCCPMEYFEDYQRKGVEINNHRFAQYIHAYGEGRALSLLRGKTVIYGGGGIIEYEKHDIHKNVLDILEKFSDENGKVFIWGAGHNRIKDYEEWVETNKPHFYPAYFDKFSLVGGRDVDTKYQWVPCVSCMHEAFDLPTEARHEYVAFLHGNESEGFREVFKSIPVLYNIENDNLRESEKNFLRVI